MLGANNAGGAALQARSNDPAGLWRLTKAAETIEMRFKKAESDKQFGQGLDKSLVGKVERDSETFWDDVKGLTPADTEGLSDADAQDLQKVVQQVAQMDDDLDDPKRTDKVAGEYDTIRAELQDVDGFIDLLKPLGGGAARSRQHERRWGSIPKWTLRLWCSITRLSANFIPHLHDLL